jgi:hypothetical protein
MRHRTPSRPAARGCRRVSAQLTAAPERASGTAQGGPSPGRQRRTGPTPPRPTTLGRARGLRRLLCRPSHRRAGSVKGEQRLPTANPAPRAQHLAEAGHRWRPALAAATETAPLPTALGTISGSAASSRKHVAALLPWRHRHSRYQAASLGTDGRLKSRPVGSAIRTLLYVPRGAACSSPWWTSTARCTDVRRGPHRAAAATRAPGPSEPRPQMAARPS